MQRNWCVSLCLITIYSSKTGALPKPTELSLCLPLTNRPLDLFHWILLLCDRAINLIEHFCWMTPSVPTDILWNMNVKVRKLGPRWRRGYITVQCLLNDLSLFCHLRALQRLYWLSPWQWQDAQLWVTGDAPNSQIAQGWMWHDSLNERWCA